MRSRSTRCGGMSAGRCPANNSNARRVIASVEMDRPPAHRPRVQLGPLLVGALRPEGGSKLARAPRAGKVRAWAAGAPNFGQPVARRRLPTRAPPPLVDAAEAACRPVGPPTTVGKVAVAFPRRR